MAVHPHVSVHPLNVIIISDPWVVHLVCHRVPYRLIQITNMTSAHGFQLPLWNERAFVRRRRAE